MAVATRSLPTDSPIPYFKPIERGYMSKGSQEGVYATPYVEPSVNTETDRVSSFTGLDDYDTLFAARHGRGALDPVPTFGDQTFKMSLDVPTPKAGAKLINPREQLMSTYGEAVSKQKESRRSQTTPPGSEIIGEGAAVFTDMTETILDALDKQVDTSTSYQQVGKSSLREDEKETNLKEKSQVPTQKDDFS